MNKFQSENEQKRIDALKFYNVLDTLPEGEFDDITQLASEICNTPIALISLIDEDRQWFKSRVGLEVPETARDISFCTHALGSEQVFEVASPLTDERFAGNPLVTGYPYIRYYAGAPLITNDGQHLGTLCVINSVPHTLTDGQKKSLEILARSVMSILNLRQKEKESAFFRDALNEVAAVSVTNRDDQFEYVNDKFCDLADLDPDEIIGRHYSEIPMADVSEDDSNAIRAIVNENKIYRGRIRNKNRNGALTWSNLTVIPYSAGGVNKTFSLRIDTTNEVTMLQRLEEAEQLSKTGNWEFNVLNGNWYWSKGLYTMMGFATHEIETKSPSLLDYMTANDKRRLKQSMEEMIKGNEKVMLKEIQVITKDKRIRELSVTGKKVCNSKGEVIMLNGTIQDITERKEAEMRIEESESKYRTLVEETSQMIYTTDKEGYNTYASSRIKKVIGYEDEDIIGKRFAFIYDEAWRKKAIKFYMQQLRDQKDETSFTFPVKNKEGQKVWFEQIATLVRDHGVIQGFRCVLHDVTERVKNEEAMRAAAKMAQEAKEMQQNFLGKMSHELRTPMNGVVGMANLLKDSALAETQRVYVDGIRESADNMLRIINDILDISKIESGKMTFEETDFDLRHIINSLIFTVEPMALQKNVSVKPQVDESIPLTVSADPVRLSQILLNLTGNALKFTEKGEIGVIVKKISEKNRLLELEFKVTDTGIGIAADKLDKIFESYTQAESDTTRKYGGTGLGLTIARQLVEQQNGKIRVESEPGKGTVFTFTYHCKLPKMPGKNAVVKGRDNQFHQLNGSRILVVEDNIINQKVARFTLEKWGAEVTVADRGYKAIDLLRDQQYDMILMDLQMPEMSGIQATDIIRRELGLNTPIMAMTASAMKGEKDHCINVGMNDYFSKPFEPIELNRKLHLYLS